MSMQTPVPPKLVKKIILPQKMRNVLKRMQKKSDF